MSSAGVTRPDRPGLDLSKQPPAVRLNKELGFILTFKLKVCYYLCINCLCQSVNSVASLNSGSLIIYLELVAAWEVLRLLNLICPLTTYLFFVVHKVNLIIQLAEL